MAKITFSKAVNLSTFVFGSWTGATVTSTSTSVKLTLGTEILTLSGAFTGTGAALSGTISGLTYVIDTATADPVTQFTVSGLAVSYSNFTLAMADDDLSAVFGAGNDWLLGSASSEVLRGYAGNDLMLGNAGNDVLYGSYGNDTLNGGSGNDTMQGGSGNDLYVVDVSADKIVELSGGGTDTVETALLTYTLGSQLENLTYTGTANFTGTGNTLNNVIVGGKGADKLYGLSGNDTLRGGNGNDTLDGGDGNDFLVGDSAASFVTTSASGVSPTNAALPISLSLTMPEVAPTGATSTAISGYINNATLGANRFNLAFVVDVSGSMSGTFSGSTVGDVNKDGYANEKVDAAIASFQSLVASIKASGLGDLVRISLIPFSDSSDIRAIGTASSDANANGVADVIDAALKLNDLGGTEYTAGLNKAIEFFNSSPKGDNFVFFISDGAPNSQNYASQLATLRSDTGINATIRSLGIESSGYYNVLDLLDDGLANNSAIDVKSPSSLTTGLLSSQVNLTDIKQLEIYKNGVLQTTLTPAQLTQTPFGLKYSYTVTGLSATGADNIETRLVLKDASSSFISTNQRITVGTLASNDSLVGGAGNDTLDGGVGVDTLVGGLGNDVYQVNSTSKVIVELAASGTDRVESTVTYSLNNAAHANIENLTLAGSSNTSATGNALGNRIEGNIGNNVLNGLAGNDILVGGYGTDIASYANSTAAMTVNLTNGTATATGKADSLTGIEGVWGGAYADMLTGDALDNSFRGNGGNDTISGGSGFDTLDYSAATSAITANLNSAYYGTVTSANGAEGTDSIYYYDVEGVIGSKYSDVIRDVGYYASSLNNLFDGGAGNDNLDGGTGNDTLIGGTGNDILTGGSGIDLVDYSKATGKISGSIAGNMVVSATVVETDQLSGIESIIGTAYADSIVGAFSNDSLDGGAGNDTLKGEAGNDTLRGGTGVDSLVGGAGDDTFYLDSLSDVVVELANGGKDTMIIDLLSGSGSKSLGEVENVTLLGSAAVNISGGAAANSITGNDGNNSLSGAGGSDTIVGGAGNDTINGGDAADTLNGGDGVDWLSYAGSATAVNGTLNYSLATGTGTDSVSYFENIMGTSFGDTITGDSYANVIDGAAGNDNLYGGGGDDILKGGTGNDLLDGDYGVDTVSYAYLTTAINADLSTGVVVNSDGNDTLVEIEVLVGTAGNDTLAWKSASTSYTDFKLNGGAGNDSLVGSLGDDTLIGGVGNDTLNGGTGGYDIADYSSAAGAVTVRLNTSAIQNTVNAGTDTLINIDGIIGSAFADTLTGNTTTYGYNYFTGGLGADTLDGGVDANGYDRYIYSSVSESKTTAYDTIKNFTSGSYYDDIDLSLIDANTTDSYTSSSFSFVGSAGFSGTAGELRYAKSTTDTFVYGDVNGDKVSDLMIKLTGLHDLTASDFYL